MRGFIMPVELHVTVSDRGQVPAVGRLLIQGAEVATRTATGNFSINRASTWETPYRLTD
ncbi:hypothetical protein D3C81_2292640 [compost metagenome]